LVPAVRLEIVVRARRLLGRRPRRGLGGIMA
jgi:hypothetical protein